MLSSRPKKSQTLRVGFLSRWDMNDPNAMSGTVYRCATALKDIGIELVDCSNLGRHEKSVWTQPIAHPKIEKTFSPRTRALPNRIRGRIKTVLEKYTGPWNEHREINFAKIIGDRANEKLHAKQHELDAVFGVCSSAEIANLDTDVPIIYASDTTAQLFNESYLEQQNRSHDFKEAQNSIEMQALKKCQYFLPATECGYKSALQDYKVPQEHVKIIEFGAHITPRTKISPKSTPTKDSLQLCVVASDPERKQVPLCIAIAEELAQRGWNVQLNYIGEYHPAITKSKLVNWSGRLQLGKTDDRDQHRKILSDSHWMLLPSKAEAFGIAACEAAHFGLPCAVSDIGGLPTVVKNGVTGLVLPIQADSTTYADALEKVMLNKKQYTEMSRASIARAVSTLSWDIWAQRVKDVVQECVSK